MSKDNLDFETKKELSEADALRAMFSTVGWEVAETSLKETIAQLRDARSLVLDDQVELNLKVNLAVADNLEIWLDDLKGRIENATMVLTESNTEGLITRR